MVDRIAYEYGWTVDDIFSLSRREVLLLYQMIGERRKAEADAWSGKSGKKPSSGNTLKMDSDEALKRLEAQMPGSVFEEGAT